MVWVGIPLIPAQLIAISILPSCSAALLTALSTDSSSVTSMGMIRTSSLGYLVFSSSRVPSNVAALMSTRANPRMPCWAKVYAVLCPIPIQFIRLNVMIQPWCLLTRSSACDECRSFQFIGHFLLIPYGIGKKNMAMARNRRGFMQRYIDPQTSAEIGYGHIRRIWWR